MWSSLGVVWGQKMYGSAVPEASKLPVIFPMMQRSAHNQRESILLCCSLSSSPAHRLTGCHNNPGPAPCLLEQNSGKPTTTTAPLVTRISGRICWICDKYLLLGADTGDKPKYDRYCSFLRYISITYIQYITPSDCLIFFLHFQTLVLVD